MRRLLPLIAAVLLVGCGNDRTPVPDIDHPLAPDGKRGYDLTEAGISFTAPGNWQEVKPTASLVGGVRSRTATLVIWRYARTEPLPADQAAVRAARERLLDDVRERDTTFKLRRTRLRPDGFELVGRQTMAGVRVGIRSLHLFKAGHEVVVDAYAPPEEFRRVDHQVFRPVIRTLKVK